MTSEKVERLIDLIDELLSEHGPWQEKRRAVLEMCGEGQVTLIEEFASWFERESDL